MATIATTAQYFSWEILQGIDTNPNGLDLALAQATAEIQRICGREFLPSPAASGETESRILVGDGTKLLFVPDALNIVSVSSTSISTWRAEQATPITYIELTSGVFLEGATVTLTGRFGYAEQAALPADLVEACCMLAAVRLSGAAEWSNVQSNVKRQKVMDVDIEYFEGSKSNLQAKRDQAIELIIQYQRLF